MKAANKAMVGIVAAICMMGLVAVLRNVLQVPAEVLSRDMIVYILVYFGFITAVNFTEEVPVNPGTPGRVYDNPWAWSALAAGITFAIIAVYAVT
jgi:hypothetical protein